MLVSAQSCVTLNPDNMLAINITPDLQYVYVVLASIWMFFSNREIFPIDLFCDQKENNSCIHSV